MAIAHWTIYADNESDKEYLFERILKGGDLPEGFGELNGLQGGLFSPSEIAYFIEEEVRHDRHALSQEGMQPLQTMSSGERKKALLHYLLDQPIDFLILDNPLDNLDGTSRIALTKALRQLAKKIAIIQLINRREDRLTLPGRYYELCRDQLLPIAQPEVYSEEPVPEFTMAIPLPPDPISIPSPVLVRMRKVSIAYGDKPVLDQVSWELKAGEYWQLSGPNGSGKTTLLSLITGENPKAYGQDITLFGRRKGSGESVWDIKEKLGYFTPAMTDRFRGYHSLENMLISGLHDSIGLYVSPTPAEKRLARIWLQFLGMEDIGKHYFHQLSSGQQRLIMCVRAMIKHPPLLILDEPTAGLDDANAALVVNLVNRMAEASQCCIVFVSHRREPGLLPQFTLVLSASPAGSRASVSET